MERFETETRRPRRLEALKASTIPPKNLLPDERAGTPINPIAAMMAENITAPQFASRDDDPGFASQEPKSSYTVELELPCEECGGSGFDPGGIDPWGPEPCPACQGAKTQRITRNYLAEALRIVGNPACLVPIERAHLAAIVDYCRQAVSAVVVVSLPDVPERAQARLKRSSRHGRAEVTRTHEVSQIERR